MEAVRLHAKDVLDPESQMHYNFVSRISFTYDIHCHDFYEIFLIVHGNAVHNVNGAKQLLGEGSMVFIRPDDIHSYEQYKTDDCQFINVAFSENTVHALFDYLGEGFPQDRLLSGEIPPVVLLSAPESSIVKEKLEYFTLIPLSGKKQMNTYLRILLADFMSNYFTTYRNYKNIMPQWMDHLIEFMKRKENLRAGLPLLHQLSNKSPGYLSRVFKEYLNKTPTGFVNELRLNYAVNMLVHSDMSILDISLDAGFNSLSHFYHLFKKQYHLSPDKFKKLNQKTKIPT